MKTDTETLPSQEGTTPVVSLQGDDALTLVDLLDQAFEAPNMESGLRRKSVRILRRVCGSHIILPRTCILSENIAKEGDTAVIPGRFTDVWMGSYNRNRVCIKAFCTRAAGSSRIKQCLFREIVVWRRLSHPNVLPVLGVSPKLFPLCIITQWMTNGNIMDFTSMHPEANRLHLLAEASRGLQYLHSIRIVHSRLKPANILIDRNCLPRLTDYGLPLQLDPVEGGFYPYDDLQHLAPELLDPSFFGLENRTSTKESDIFAFGTVAYQVLTGRQPFPGVRHTIIGNIVTGARPPRPPGSNEWISDNVWNLISRCWSTFWDVRPGASLVVNALSDAGDLVEFRRREPDLIAFLDVSKAGAKDPEAVRAQEFVDVIDLILDNGGHTKQVRKQYLKHLRKLCCIFAILPSSFALASTLDRHEVAPFDSGGYSDVYRATFKGRPVVIKTLKATITTDRKKLHRLLVKEVVGWKWLRHENILPFVGVMFTPLFISIVSEQMENGNIMTFVVSHPRYNRLRLLVDVVIGLEYLHEHDIVHGDLKGANILIDSNYRARLADFGLAVVIGESTAGNATNNRGAVGTIRWMAPELMHPEEFGFTGEHRKRLPSRSTDTYALGMTILEVVTGRHPFSDVTRDVTVMCKVLKGERPDGPPAGLPDQLWGLLVATWHVEHESRPSKRPPTSVILGRLKEETSNWGESSVQLQAPTQPERKHGTDITSGRLDDDPLEMATAVRPTPSYLRRSQTNPSEVIQHYSGSLGNVGRVRGFFCLGR